MSRLFRHITLNWSTFWRHMLLGGLPLVFGIIVALSYSGIRYKEVADVQGLEEMLETVTVVNAVVHAMQAERGRSASFLASGGHSGRDELIAQRAVVDEKIEAWQAFELGAVPPLFAAYYDEVKTVDEDVARIRTKVDGKIITGPEMVEVYKDIIARLQHLSDLMAQLTQEPSLAVYLDGYNALLRAKEQTGLQRAIDTRIATQLSFTNSDYDLFIIHRTLFQAYLDQYNQISDPLVQKSYEDFMNSPENLAVLEIQEQAKRYTFNLTPAEVFALHTKRVNLLFDAERQLWDIIMKKEAALSVAAWRSLILTVMGGLLCIMLSALIIYGFTKFNSEVMGEIVGAAVNMTEGDYDVELPKPGTNGISTLISTLVVFRDTIKKNRDEALARQAARQRELEAIKIRAENGRSRSDRISRDIEHTAQSTEELAQSVNSALKSTETANIRVGEMRDMAYEGTHITQNAIEAMDRIRKASDKITSIIKIIDEIAFQTNLLALNARVEAARAGPAGRGFAVVATEVQQLAARSARAAGDVSELIEEAAKEISDGVVIVEQSGSALDELAAGAGEIAALVESLTSVSRQQSATLNEINDATMRLESEMRSLSRELTSEDSAEDDPMSLTPANDWPDDAAHAQFA